MDGAAKIIGNSNELLPTAIGTKKERWSRSSGITNDVINKLQTIFVVKSSNQTNEESSGQYLQTTTTNQIDECRKKRKKNVVQPNSAINA